MLDRSPELFAPASRKKRAALSHFQPQGVLISHGATRTDHQRFNKQVLDTEQPMHRLAAHFFDVVDHEATQLLAECSQNHIIGLQVAREPQRARLAIDATTTPPQS